MSDKNRDYNQIAFALDILKLLSQGSIARRELCDRLSVILQQNGQSPGDIKQKLSRAIAKLRSCGFEIDSAPNRPYTLIESSFPVILSQQQQQALAIAAYFLADMGFSETASQIVRIGDLDLTNIELPSHVAVNFSPPVDYSQNEAKDTVRSPRQGNFVPISVFAEIIRYSTRTPIPIKKATRSLSISKLR